MFGTSISFKSDLGPTHSDRSSDGMVEELGIGDGLTLVASVFCESLRTATFRRTSLPSFVAKIKQHVDKTALLHRGTY